MRRLTDIQHHTYNDAKTIGEAFRGGTPVIMNLTDMTDAEAKRLVDFSAGLIFGLRGTIERVTNKVFLLSRSEEHTSELQSRGHLVCRLLLEKINIILLSIHCKLS